MAKRVQTAGDPDRVRRSGRGPEQDEQGHRPRGGAEGAAAAADGLVRPHLVGLPIYKMTGSGNDFVLAVARVSPPQDRLPEDMPVPCARGTRIGGDGPGFLVPRCDPALGRDGANINFISSGGAGSAWRMRTYERGVEGETLACGTGAVAAGCAIQEWGLGQLPIDIESRSGRVLTIRAVRHADGRYDDVWLAGEGRMVFTGVIT